MPILNAILVLPNSNFQIVRPDDGKQFTEEKMIAMVGFDYKIMSLNTFFGLAVTKDWRSAYHEINAFATCIANNDPDKLYELVRGTCVIAPYSVFPIFDDDDEPDGDDYYDN